MQRIFSFIKSNKKVFKIIGCVVAGCLVGAGAGKTVKLILAKDRKNKERSDTWLVGWKKGYADAMRCNGYAIGFRDGYNQAVDDADSANNDTELCAYQQGYYNGITQNLDYPEDICGEWV